MMSAPKVEHELSIRSVSAAEVMPLRHAVLRQGKPLMTAAYEGDQAEATFHLAAFEGGEIVGVASFMREPMPGREGVLAWRLRGMAVDDRLRGRRVGKRIVDRGVDLVRQAGGELLWCNARATAVGFYERMGWAAVGEYFEEHGLPHVVMWRAIADG